MNDALFARAERLPTTAGVYLFKNRRGDVIYVGKAVNLKARVRQYLSGSDERPMVPFLVRQAADVEAIATATEKEALLLENTLIKKHQPKFNVKLVDDKNFLHLRIDAREPWPRFTLVRRIGVDGARYFGPFASASRARQTLAFVQKSFPLRTCTDAVLKTRKRPCLLHQMGRCVAPCVDLTTAEDYAAILDDAVLFLEGKRRPLVARLTARMRAQAEAERFEDAARTRDLLRSIEATLERQQVIDPRLGDRDVWGLFREGAAGAVTVMPVRDGAMGEPRITLFDGEIGDDGELLSSWINALYAEGSEIPREILVPVAPADADALGEVLGERRAGAVEVRVPQRGDKVRLVELATENARLRYHTETDADARRDKALDALAEVVGLGERPRRIECFDNSNLGGENPVAAMAVLVDGEPARAEFRRYRIKRAPGDDDYAMMRETLTRRFTHVLEGEPGPDLLVIDGGRGQLNVALAVLADLGLSEQPVVGLSKPRTEHRRGERDATDKVVLPNAKDPIRLRDDHPGLRLLQRVRDEAHRHAVGYQRKVRNRETLTSVLDGIPGVGPARRRALLQVLGSAAAVADADVDVLAAVPGIGRAMAERIRTALDS
jgi:excinuclease ABC subunit C